MRKEFLVTLVIIIALLCISTSSYASNSDSKEDVLQKSCSNSFTDLDFENQTRMIIAKQPSEIISIENTFYQYIPFYNGGVTAEARIHDTSGVHYMVRSNQGGYHMASGTFEFPKVDLLSSLTDPDVPYGFFGIYTTDGTIGFDLGAYYSQKQGKWHFVISGYVKNSAGKYAKYWKTLKSSFSPSQLKKVNFVARIEKGNVSDKVSLKIMDASTWKTIGTITVDTSEKGYNNVDGASRSYVNSNYMNVYFNREVTLAHARQSNRPLTGSTIKQAKWSMVYLYSKQGYSKWDEAKTVFAARIGQTLMYANRVSVRVIKKWFEDITNISY